jgi:hypothetical protein
MALDVTSLALAACGGKTIGNGAVAGTGEAIDASTDSSAAQPTESSAPVVDDAPAVIDASIDSLPIEAMDAVAPTERDVQAFMDISTDSSTPHAVDAAAPTVEPAPGLNASPVPLDAFGGQQTFYAASCGMPDAQAPPSPPACPCNGAAAACSLPDAGAAECTSTDLHGQTCESLGFSGGTLGCTASCSFDTSGCDTCVAGLHTACASVHVGEGLASKSRTDFYLRTITEVAFALAASDTEIGLAWGDGSGTVHFTRLRQDLTLLSDDCIPTHSFDALSVASTSTGWLIAAHGDDLVDGGGFPKHGIFLYPLDRAARLHGPSHVVWGTYVGGSDLGGNIAFESGPSLVWNAAGPRLLLTWVESDFFWRPYAQSQLRVLTEDGTAVGPQVTLPGSDPSTLAMSDGFEATATQGPGARSFPDYSGARLFHIAFDGVVRNDEKLNAFDSARLSGAGSEIHLLYRSPPTYPSTQPGPGFLQRIRAAGAPIGNPAPIDAGSGYALAYDTLLSIGPDSVVHVTQGANSRHVENLMRLDPSGVPVLPPVPAIRANYAVTLQAVAQGGDAVVAWTAPSNLRPTRIELARVRLTP